MGDRRVFARAATVLAAVMLQGCVGYVPGQQTHWDSKIRQLCERDGGMTVFERMRLTEAQYQALGGRNRDIPIPSVSSGRKGYPVVTRTAETILNARDPKVYREETDYVRVLDGKILAKLVRYWRVGGDLPSFGHPTTFSCPDQQQAVGLERDLFVVLP